MSEMQNIQWFPGHMTKTKRQIQTSLKLVDAVAEIIDARIPVSSRNPDLDSIIQNKPRVVLMNKCDMADPSSTQKWINYFKNNGIVAIPIDCKTGRGRDCNSSGLRTLLRPYRRYLKRRRARCGNQQPQLLRTYGNLQSRDLPGIPENRCSLCCSW